MADIPDNSQVTVLLQAAQAGDPDAMPRLRGREEYGYPAVVRKVGHVGKN